MTEITIANEIEYKLRLPFICEMVFSIPTKSSGGNLLQSAFGSSSWKNGEKKNLSFSKMIISSVHTA